MVQADVASRRLRPAVLGAAGLLLFSSLLAFPTAIAGPPPGGIRVGTGTDLSPRESALVPTAGSVGPAGSTIETLFPNYNGSLPGNFPSTVDDWQVGTPAVVTKSDTLWLPELPVATHGPPAPVGAPAVVYNLTTNSFEGFVPALSNASAFAYDAGNGYLYATDPLTNSVEVFDPNSQQIINPAISVGTRPVSIGYDPVTHYLYVANAGTNNVSVIDAYTDKIAFAGIAVGNTPSNVIVDPDDGWVYVANANTSKLSILSASNPTTPETPIDLAGPAYGLAYSVASRTVAVTVPSSNELTIITTTTNFVSGLGNVGTGAEAVVSDYNGSMFIVANASGPSVILVNSTSGTVFPTTISVAKDPSQLVLSPLLGDLVVWSSAGRNLTTVDLESEQISSTSATLGPIPSGIAYDSDLSRLFVGDSELPGIEVLNATSGRSILRPIPLPGPPTGLAMDSGTGTLYVGTVGSVVSYSATSGIVESRNALLPGVNGPFVVASTGGLLWDAREGSNEILGLNLTTLQPVVDVLRVGVESAYVQSMVLDPQTSVIFALNYSSGNLVAFSAASGKVLDRSISGGTNVTSIAFDSSDGLLYVSGNSVRAINPTNFTPVGPPVSLPSHAGVTGSAFDSSRDLIYIVTTSGVSGQGTVTVVDGSSTKSLDGPVVTFRDGLDPGDLITLSSKHSELNDSGIILSANSLSGTIGVIGVPPSISSFSFEPSDVDVNQTTHAVVVASGGAGSSNVSFSGLPAGCQSASRFDLSCTPTASGTAKVTVTVTDSVGQTATAVAYLNVGSPLQLEATFGSLATPQVDLNRTFAASALASGGTPPYTYAWTFGDGAWAIGSPVTHQYSAVGTYSVVVTATDNAGAVAVESAAVQVLPLPSVSPYAAPGLSTDANLPVRLFANETGGTAPGVASWNFGDNTTGTGAEVSHSWAGHHAYTVTLSYEDASGAYANSSFTVNVARALGGTFRAVPAISSPVPGTSFEFEADIQNGTPPYSVVWSFGGGVTASGTKVSQSFSSPGTYTVGVEVEDAAGGVLSTTVSVTVGSPSSGAPTILGENFGPGLALGLFVGIAAASALMFVVERSRRRTLPAPPSPYVPPPNLPGSGKRN